MGLESFSTNRENPIGEVKSRKKLDNLTVSRSAWRQIISMLGGKFPTSVAEDMTDEELKSVIKLYDEEIVEETYFALEDRSSVEGYREDLVSVLESREQEEE